MAKPTLGGRSVQSARSGGGARSQGSRRTQHDLVSKSSGRIQSEAAAAVGAWGARSYDEAVADLPEGWVVQKSKSCGRYFYVNALTHEARWIKPHRKPEPLRGGDVRSLLQHAANTRGAAANHPHAPRPRSAAAAAAADERRGATTNQVMYPAHFHYERRSLIRPPTHALHDLHLAPFDGETSYQQQYTVDSFNTLTHRRRPVRTNRNFNMPHSFTEDRTFLTTNEEMAAHVNKRYPPRWRVRSAGARRGVVEE